MFENIKKRDGRIVEFDSSKITAAIAKAGKATGEFEEREAKKLTLRVLTLAHELRLGPHPEVEEIQDIVERVLLDSPFYKTAKAYILYREQHSQIRSISTKASIDLVEHYIQKLDWKIKENSNMCYSLQGLNNYISSDVTSEYWLNRIYPPEIRNAHKNGDIHIHDLSLLSVYCVGWDLKDLLKPASKVLRARWKARRPNTFAPRWARSSIFSIPFRAKQPVPRPYPILIPFWPRLFDMTSWIIMMSNRPFRNLSLISTFRPVWDFKPLLPILPWIFRCPPRFGTHPVIIGGNEQEETYAEFQPEMDLINRAFAEVMMEGDARGRVFTFPIPTYNITADFDWDNPNLEMIWKMTGKYGIPYFSNFVNSDMSPEDARSMCCRLRLDNRELLKRGGGLFGANPLTGSIGVVTINLPRIGFLAQRQRRFSVPVGREGDPGGR